jgi:hypothetical protein
MIRLPKSLNAWGTLSFRDVLKSEIEQLDSAELPLQQGLSSGSYALRNGHSAMVIAASEKGGSIRAKVGIFYNGIIAGCSCADDPTPVGELSEYCEVQVDIHKETAEATITLVAD